MNFPQKSKGWQRYTRNTISFNVNVLNANFNICGKAAIVSSGIQLEALVVILGTDFR